MVRCTIYFYKWPTNQSIIKGVALRRKNLDVHVLDAVATNFIQKKLHSGARDEHDYFNLLNRTRICFIQGFSAYRAVNTLHFGYKNQSLNVL
jgi:hypothetical protein